MECKNNSFYIGAHLSISSGHESAARVATEIGANTFQFFTRNPRGGGAKPFNPEDAIRAEEWMQNHEFAPLLAHAPYTINLASDTSEIRQNGIIMMKEDLNLLNKLSCDMYNIHPGSRQSASPQEGIIRIADCINRVLEECNDNRKTVILLETMSGKGSEVGSSFEELRSLMDAIHNSERIGICMDTCHVYCAGYDIVNDLDGVLRRFDEIIGLKRLRALHLNDSKYPVGSGKDRHERIGEGYIGTECFKEIVNHPKLRDLPMFLETPNDTEGYCSEIGFLKGLRN